MDRKTFSEDDLIMNKNRSSIENVQLDRFGSSDSLFVSDENQFGSILNARPIEIISDDFNVDSIQTNLTLTNYLSSKENSFKTNSIRRKNFLQISMLKIQGLINKKKYHIEISCEKNISQRTTTKKQYGKNIIWQENFIFNNFSPENSMISCKIYLDKKQSKIEYKSCLISYVNIPLLDQMQEQLIEQSFHLETNLPKSKRIHLTIKFRYESIEILPIQFYIEFEQYIRRNCAELIRIIEPYLNLNDKHHFEKLLTAAGESFPLILIYLIDRIEDQFLFQSNNGFKENLYFDNSIKRIAKRYLDKRLKNILNEIIFSINGDQMDYEVDPDRISNLKDLEINQIRLRLLIEKIWLDIQQSHYSFPIELKFLFSQLRHLSVSDERIYSFLSNILFIRWICPSILAIQSFQFHQEYSNEKLSRTLTFISKILEKLANFSKFSSKELYMEFLNDFLVKQSDNMRRFLSNISTVENQLIKNHIHFSSNTNSTMTNLPFQYHSNDQLEGEESYSWDNNQEIYSSKVVNVINSSDDENLSEENSFILTNQSVQQSTISFSSSSLFSIDQFSKESVCRKNSLKKENVLISSKRLIPKLGVKALDYHLNTNKKSSSQQLSIDNLYEQEKSRRIQLEKQIDELKIELNRSKKKLEEYGQLIDLITNKCFIPIHRNDFNDQNQSKANEKNFIWKKSSSTIEDNN